MSTTLDAGERFRAKGSLAAPHPGPGGTTVIWARPTRDTSPAATPRPAVVDLDEELPRHHQAAFGWALACCKWDRSQAEDVLQTAYLKVIDGRARFAGRGDFRAFLFAVIRNTARDERRRRALRELLPLDGPGRRTRTPTVPAEVVDDVVRAESSRRLVDAIERISSRQREVLLLIFYHDLTIAEAAEILGVSLGTARVHYERGKAQLRRLLVEE